MPDPIPAASFETPLSLPSTVSADSKPSMPDIPQEAVQAAARAMVTIYQGYQADGVTSADEEAARAALEAAAPVLAAQVRRETAEQIAREIESATPFHWTRSQARAWAARAARQIGESR